MSQVQGVRTLDDIKGRCRIDRETGCWIWSGAAFRMRNCLTPKVWLTPEACEFVGEYLKNAKGKTVPAARAAWRLAGKPLPPGHVVWRSVCGNGLCVKPEHCRSGTHAESVRAAAATGRNRGKPERSAVNFRNQTPRRLKPETVHQAEQLLQTELKRKDIAARLGIHIGTLYRIGRGQHSNCSTAIGGLAGSTVFSWRP